MLAELAAAVLATATPPIVVTRDSLDLPAGCSPREVGVRITGMLDAWARADAAALDRMFAPRDGPAPGFQWFTAPGIQALERPGLVRALVRHARSVRLREVNLGRSWVRGGVGFAFVSDQGNGKGELHCPTRRFYVWSMGAAGPGTSCPGEDETAVLVCARGGRAPTAQDVSPGYSLGTTTLRLPARCRPAAVERRILTMLRAFNLGDGEAFASGFVADRPDFHPYTAAIPATRFIGRAAIAGFVSARYERGDGWTALELGPPQGTVGLPERTVYVLRLAVGGVGPAGSKLVVDCRSGLLLRWVGPGVAPPG